MTVRLTSTWIDGSHTGGDMHVPVPIGTSKANVRYGRARYITNCGRFQIMRVGSREWRVIDTSPSNGWSAWLAETGLRRACFATRRDAVAALEEVLDAADLRDAPAPG